MSDDERPDVFLQWKNTDACLDFWCACGADLHFDGYFARDFTCGQCGQTWELPHKLVPAPVALKGQRRLTKLLFNVPVLPDGEGKEFMVRWPRPSFEDPGGTYIVEIHDEVWQNEVTSVHRAWYADLLKVQPTGDGAVMLRLRTRNPVR